jgi:two-component system, cell cycle response regulator
MMGVYEPRIAQQRIDPAPCSVLVVDDDDLIRAQLMAVLNHAGFQVQGADGGAQALQMLNVTPCDVLLTDWEMPDMDGPALCRALRLRDSDRETYVMMLSVRCNAEDILVGLAAGADDYVVKGAASEELLVRIGIGRRTMRVERPLSVSWAQHYPLSMSDPLTGAHNNRFLTTYLPRELARSRRLRPPLALLSCDIDRFKHTNDAFGREAADQVLRSFVGLSTALLRDGTDWIARVGGDEFIIVLPETTLDGASRIAERLHATLSEGVCATNAGLIRTTVSIGATALETPKELAATSVIELLRAADRCMYLSKRRGRDRTTAMRPSEAALQSFAESAETKYEIN